MGLHALGRHGETYRHAAHRMHHPVEQLAYRELRRVGSDAPRVAHGLAHQFLFVDETQHLQMLGCRLLHIGSHPVVGIAAPLLVEGCKGALQFEHPTHTKLQLVLSSLLADHHRGQLVHMHLAYFLIDGIDDAHRHHRRVELVAEIPHQLHLFQRSGIEKEKRKLNVGSLTGHADDEVAALIGVHGHHLVALCLPCGLAGQQLERPAHHQAVDLLVYGLHPHGRILRLEPPVPQEQESHHRGKDKQ